MKTALAVLLFLISQKSFAQSAADQLLNTLGGTSTLKMEPLQARGERVITRANLNDPFQRQLFAQVETNESLPSEFRDWIDKVFSGNYLGALQSWRSLESRLPVGFENSARATYVYILLKLDLGQTFINQWVKDLADSGYAHSPAELALEKSLGRDFDQWLIEHSVILTPEQEALIGKLESTKPQIGTLRAWIELRKRGKGDGILSQLPAESRFRRYLAQRTILSYVEKNKLVDAARAVKTQLEPGLVNGHESSYVVNYYMTIARLLYQSGQYQAASQYYEKIPNSSPDFLQAQQELIWALLRQGERSKLRGKLETMGSPALNDKFVPEVALVKAISDLQMCSYGSVAKDFDEFTRANQVWAKKIDQALSEKDVSLPPSPDFFSQMAKNAVVRLSGESRKLGDLELKEDQKNIDAALEGAKRTQNQESLRQWRNMKAQLSEAVRKMRFVKVEYLDQMRRYSQAGIERKSWVASNGDSVPVKIEKKSDELIFPVRGEVWPDEVFRLRSTASSNCRGAGGAR